MRPIERSLLVELIKAHLSIGHPIGLKGREWLKVSQDGTIRFMTIEGQETKEWASADSATDDIMQQISLKKLRFDDITFYDADKTGVTWRFLKLDMPYLRIVLGEDKKAIGAITSRLSAILKETLEEGTNDPSVN